MEIDKSKILSEISNLTRIIEEEYPELQKYLDESRSTLPQGSLDSSISNVAMENYRDSLKLLIEPYDKKTSLE